MKPWYMKKKIWVGVITGVASAVSYMTGNDEVGNAVMIIGSALIAAIGLEDFGKANESSR